MYDNGSGVATNKTKAVELYRKAAEKGHMKAQYNLGLSYKLGDGVSVNRTEARKWLQKAADQGHENARKALSSL